MTKIRAYKDLAGVLFLALVVITFYSIWGSYILSSGDAPQQIAAVER